MNGIMTHDPNRRVEAPGYILEVVAGSVWFTQDGTLTDKWEERGVWLTHEAAEEAMNRFFTQHFL